MKKMMCMIGLLGACVAVAAPPAFAGGMIEGGGWEQRGAWEPDGPLAEMYLDLEVLPEWRERLDKVIYRAEFNRDKYQEIEAARENGVPWFFVAALHERESSSRFSRHLHEGSPLSGRTRYIPKGRPRAGNPPFTWRESAIDALYLLKDLENKVPDWQRSAHAAIDQLERFNGLGYRLYRPEVGVSPYLVSGSNLYRGGKYVADGRFSRTAIDKQPGILSLIKRWNERGGIRWPKV